MVVRLNSEASARQKFKKALQYSPKALKFGENALHVASAELLNLNSRCGGSYAVLFSEAGKDIAVDAF